MSSSFNHKIMIKSIAKNKADCKQQYMPKFVLLKGIAQNPKNRFGETYFCLSKVSANSACVFRSNCEQACDAVKSIST